MMTLPADMDSCLHKHAQFLLQSMAPDGVYVYMSGAKLLNPEDHQRYTWAHDNYGKNHALLTTVAKHGTKGFEAFLEALETTNQTDIADRLRDTLREKNGNVSSNVESIGKIKNPGEMTSTRAKRDDVAAASSSSSAVYVVRPKVPAAAAAAASPSFSSRQSRSRSLTRTPLTPPLTEVELDEHLARLKSLLRTIRTTHGDRHCRQEAEDLLGELGQAGEAMVDRLRQLSEENMDKERELRRAKFMVRGMETEIERMKTTSTTVITTTPRVDPSSLSGEPEKNGKPQKSKLCAIL